MKDSFNDISIGIHWNRYYSIHCCLLFYLYIYVAYNCVYIYIYIGLNMLGLTQLSIFIIIAVSLESDDYQFAETYFIITKNIIFKNINGVKWMFFARYVKIVKH